MCHLLVFVCLMMISPPARAVETYADIVEEVMPSVVNISTQKEIIDKNENIDNLMVEQELSGRETLGSGFFIRSDGHILTNYHVVNGAQKIWITTEDGKNYDAKITGIDKLSDLAVLKIVNPKGEKPSFKPVNFGNADNARIGDIVLTIGNPYGLGASVSQGIISAKSRKIGLGDQQYLQTDASINQGNSGGPMFNIEGEVIGVNAAIFTEKGASGVGFALPSNIANWVSNQLMDTGKVRRGWIGLTVANGVDRYTGTHGFVITEINEESNAYKEGLRVGDVIVAYNDKHAEDLGAFMRFTETMEPNQILRLKVMSYGEEIREVIRVQEMPAQALKEATNKALVESMRFNSENEEKGIFYISELNIAVREATPRGLMIVKLEKRSPLYGKGIKEGDIILEADRADIYSPDNLLESIHNSVFEDYRPISLLIQGIDNIFYATIEMAAEND